MREVDRLMPEELRIDLAQMMENAGRALAVLARRLLGGDVRGRRVVALVGSGGNGGGGLVAARRLSTWGARVSVVLGRPVEAMKDVPVHQLAIVERLGIPRLSAENCHAVDRALAAADLVLDALVGYSLRGAPREPVTRLIRTANARGGPILTLDVPSGLDPDTGEPSEPTVRATTTLTLALPKIGLGQPAAHAWVGDLYVADISVPEVVYRRLGLNVGPLFAHDDIVHVVPEALAANRR